MRRLRTLSVASLLLLGGAACGDAIDAATDTTSDATSDTGSNAGSRTESDDPSAMRSDAELEPIKARGVAAVVRDAIGPERIATYSSFSEDDSVGVQVRLAGGRDVLVVMVQTQGGPPPVADCDDLAGTGSSNDNCTVAPDGTILVSGAGEAFSDGNSRGSTVRATSVNPETNRVVYSLYEAYTARPALNAETLAQIVSDPTLAAMTAPSTNEAGADIALERTGG